MPEQGKTVLNIPEFAALLKTVSTPLQADIVAWFGNNPETEIDAIEMSGKLRRDDIDLVRETMVDLEEAGVLSGEVKGTSQTRHFRLAPGGPAREALDRVFSRSETRGRWREFRTALVELERAAKRKRKILILAGILLGGLILAGGILLLARAGSGPEEEIDLSDFTGVHETHYPNNQIKSRIEYSAGRRQGAFASWFDNGQRMAEGAYRDNRPHGRWIFWNERGEPFAAVTYQNGRAVEY